MSSTGVVEQMTIAVTEDPYGTESFVESDAFIETWSTLSMSSTFILRRMTPFLLS